MKKKLLIGAVLLSLVVVVPNDRTVRISGEFTPEMVQSVVNDLNDSLAEDAPQLVIIESPGGRVDSLENITLDLQDKNYSSYVPTFAASCAAYLMLLAPNTIYASAEAIIVQHSAMTGYGMNQGALEDAVASDIVPPELLIMGLTMERIKVDLVRITELNNRLLDKVLERHPNLNKQDVIRDIYGDFRKDVEKTAQELKDYGFDIQIGKPHMEVYTKMPVMRLLHSLIKKVTSFTWFFREV